MKLQDIDVTILKPGDVLVLRPDKVLTPKQWTKVMRGIDKLSQRIGHLVVCVPHDAYIDAVRQET